MTQGAETWHVKRKLLSAQQPTERIGVMLTDVKQAAWVKEQSRVEDILARIKREKKGRVGLGM